MSEGNRTGGRRAASAAQGGGPTRRGFVAGTAAAAAAVASQGPVHAAGSDRLKVGLIGCGGRGCGAAGQAMAADPGMVLWALADPFPDRLESGANLLGRVVAERSQKDASYGERFDCPPERRFSGLDGYRQLIDMCDVVLLVAPPAFRPLHLQAAVAAGRHVFCEKPVAVDSAGLRLVRDTVAEARRRNLSLVSGFCWRYAARERDLYRRIKDGAIGPVRAASTTYNAAGFRGEVPRKPEWSDMEYCIRNWQYYSWLSGDHVVEQAVHSIDKMSWAMNDDPPASVTCTGGRQLRTDRPVGNNIFDHFSAVYEYADGRRGFHNCRHFPGAASDISDYVMAAEGYAVVNGRTNVQQTVAGGTTWQSEVQKNDMYQQEHDELFASIRAGKPKNDGEQMANSTAMALMARMSAYTGQVVSWERVWESQESITPATWALDAAPPPSPIAVPGKTKLI